MGLSAFAQFITVILLFLLVLFMTYFVTKWIAGYQKVHYKGMNIEPLESYRISSNKYIQIVRIGSKYVAVAVSKDSVEKLCELSDEDMKERGQEMDTKSSFGDILGILRRNSNEG